METKEQLQKKLLAIEEVEEEKAEEARREANYQKWLKRPTDYIVGLAHADPEFFGHRYSSDEYENMIPVGVSISGNCGVTYYAVAKMTSASKTYMHNVWSYTDRNDFQKELNELVHKHAQKACLGLKARLEMMGLQSNHYYLHRSDIFPKNKIQTIEKSIKKAQKEILDTYKDSEFEKLFKVTRFEYEDGTTKENQRADLSHSSSILQIYLKENRPKLYKKYYNGK